MANYDFQIKRNDTHKKLTATLEDQDGVRDLSSGITAVKFYMKNIADGNLKVNAAATISDGANGKVEYKWQADDVDTAGIFEAEFEVEYNTGDKETFPNGPDEYINGEILEDLN